MYLISSRWRRDGNRDGTEEDGIRTPDVRNRLHPGGASRADSILLN